jgi:hypothetical protein
VLVNKIYFRKKHTEVEMPNNKDDEDDDNDRLRKRRNREDDYEDEDDHDDRRRRSRRNEEGDATGGIIPYKNPKALLSYYFGIFSFLIPLSGIVAVILGVLGFKYARENPKARGQVHASVGIGCGLITFLFWVFVLSLTIYAMIKAK